MSTQNNLTDFLTDVADAIRYVKEDTSKISPQKFSTEIRNFKPSDISISLTSDTVIPTADLNKIKEKQNRLTQAIENTIIDGEVVYKITSQNNEVSNEFYDTLFYTKEGDASGYYYMLSGVDDYLSKIELTYNMTTGDDNDIHITVFNILSNMTINGDKVTSMNWDSNLNK
jgi:hypothetical protein